MTLGTRIVVMKDGIIQQVDTPQNLYDHPTNLFVAGFMGMPPMNFIDCKVVKSGQDVLLMFGSHSIKVPDAKAAKLIAGDFIDKDVVLGIRPEDIHDEQLFIESSPESVIDARINIYEMLGAEVYLYFTIDQFDITARVNARTTARPGDTVQFAFDLSKIHIFDKESEEIIVN
jgi:multiple sugar transport system ATP-binding protein